MKIIVWGINYEPEPTGIGPFNTDLCAYLAGQGHAVTMLTTFPYYPWWKKREEDRGRIFSTQRNEGVKVCRCWHYVPAQPSTVKRLFHELSFVFTSTLRALVAEKPDVFIVVSPPLFLGMGAWLVSRLGRRPYVYHVQDLQPDAALGLGMIKPGLAVKMLYRLEKFNYAGAALLTGISEGMMAAFRQKGVPEERLYLFANWIPDHDAERAPAKSVESFRRVYGISHDTRLIAYSGNVGQKQGLEVVIDASKGDYHGQKVSWVICGEGAAKRELQAKLDADANQAVRLLPLQPDALYRSLLEESDIALITQQKGTGQFFFPSKLLSILQYGRPVLAVADETSELARAVKQGGFGLVVPSGDADALRRAAQQMIVADAAQFKTWGENGLAWVRQFQRSTVLSAFTARLAEVV